jgi:xanthine dehydrogenase YagS FAD-binding subunit
MIHQFTYGRATSSDDAARLLAEPGAVPLGGGTDLVPCIREQLATPDSVVDVTRVPGAREIEWRPDGGVRIGGAVRLAQLARDAKVRDRFLALAQACESVGTPALRTMGTIAGNLCQRPRCWYLRSGIPCHKNGGTTCPAAGPSGENQYHAILGGGPCYIVHPSDAAVALTALEATVEVRGGNPGAGGVGLGSESGSRRIPIDQFFVLPGERLDHETVLGPGEYVSAIEIPGHSAGGVQSYEKVMQRAGWDFALVSLAAVRREDGGVRLVLGGVAPKPWRVSESVEEDVASAGLSEDDIATLAERALYDTRPLAKNGYKVEMAGAVLRRGIANVVRTEDH